jgi:colanic acid biosynthesis protein WcaH
MLSDDVFKTVVDLTPLISIDTLIRKGDKILLGKRVNKSAKGFFSTGGRVKKNETIKGAMVRTAKNELNIEIKSTLKFIGVFEHFYDDSIYDNVSTHYVNLAYEYEVDGALNPPTEQHNEYKWFAIDELLESEQVYKYVKDCFKD